MRSRTPCSDIAPIPAIVRTRSRIPGLSAIRVATLGMAVAALLGAGPALGPRAAVANDLSDSPCTAGDVEIVGNGIVINEPCVCTAGSTFGAQVQFTVRNNTSTGRYCIALHLIPDGTVLTSSYDVILRDAGGSSTAPGKSGGEKYHDIVMFGTIPNFPCAVGRVCFGDAGVVRGKCSPNTCTTISWNTSPGAAACTTADQNPPGGQCRHQQVCVVGFGASLSCTAGCTPPCGGSSTLQACVTASADRGPFTYTLTGSDGSTQTQSGVAGDPSGTTCVSFTVSPTQGPSTTYTLAVADKNGCTRGATTSIPVTPITVSISAPSGAGPCNGVLRYTASVSGRSDCGFTWTIDGSSLASFAAGGSAEDGRIARASGANGEILEFRALDNTCHTIQAAASCSSGGTPCTASATKTAKQCVTATQSCP